MRARVIRFDRNVRTGPESRDHLPALDVTDPHFTVGVPGEPDYRVGTIDVYYGQGPAGDLPGGETGSRYAIIRSPRIDRQTGRPLVVVIGLERVADVEPLAVEDIEKYYGSGPKGEKDAQPVVNKGKLPNMPKMTHSDI